MIEIKKNYNEDDNFILFKHKIIENDDIEKMKISEKNMVSLEKVSWMT